MLINKKTDNDLDIIIMKALTGKEFMTIYKNDLKYVCKKLIDIFTSGGKILICGNGGSAADADHIAAEYIKDFKIKRKRRDFNILQQNDVCSRLQHGLPVFSLSIPANISSIGNDIGYSMIFAQQIYSLAKPEDAVIFLSTSGQSENIINGAVVAKTLKIPTIGITGTRKNIPLAKICDYTIHIHNSETDRIQETYMSIMHMVCCIVELFIFGD